MEQMMCAMVSGKPKLHNDDANTDAGDTRGQVVVSTRAIGSVAYRAALGFA